MSQRSAGTSVIGVYAIAKQLPEGFRVARAGQAATDADDGDGLHVTYVEVRGTDHRVSVVCLFERSKLRQTTKPDRLPHGGFGFIFIDYCGASPLRTKYVGSTSE